MQVLTTSIKPASIKHTDKPAFNYKGEPRRFECDAYGHIVVKASARPLNA